VAYQQGSTDSRRSGHANGRWMSTRIAGVAFAVAALVTAVVAMPAGATFPGTNGRISFHRFLPDKDGPDLGGEEIFSAGPDGSGEQRLTFSNDGRSSVFSDWSPDGSQVAFDSDRIDQDGLEDVVQVYTMPWNGETFGLQQLTVGPGFHGDPAWSPSGQQIAIDADWGDHPAQQGIWIVPASDPDGVTQAEAQRVTAIPAGMDFDSEPQYSPDGQWIAFTRFKSCKFNEAGPHVEHPHGCKAAIFRVRPNGTGLQQLTPWGIEASAPDWSPNGTKIAFDVCDSGRVGCRGDIYVMNADGSNRTKLTNYPTVKLDRFEFANNPVWSPNGNRILFTEWQDNGFPTWFVSIAPDGSNRAVIVNGEFFQNKVDWGTHP
jgi:Tol biopolymer transport system component